MNKSFSYYLSNFLKDYLILERNLSSNTIKSYKKTFQILLDYLVNIKKFKLTEINFTNITRDTILEFLKYLEEEKHNTVQTRNNRLSAIKTFYHYCSYEEIDNLNNITGILSIRFKKIPIKVMNYLTEEEIQEIFNNIDTSSNKGRRNLTILVLLYDTAARASEIINLKLEDINLEEKYVILTGKGNKQRVVPIMNKTKELLKTYIKENNLSTGYFIQVKNDKINDRFLRDLISKYTQSISKVISPHTFRHTRAIHWLKAGIPLIQIRDLLGHSSVITTEKYARVLNEDKFKAIEKVNEQFKIDAELKDWNDDPDLLSQLLNL